MASKFRAALVAIAIAAALAPAPTRADAIDLSVDSVTGPTVTSVTPDATNATIPANGTATFIVTVSYTGPSSHRPTLRADSPASRSASDPPPGLRSSTHRPNAWSQTEVCSCDRTTLSPGTTSHTVTVHETDGNIGGTPKLNVKWSLAGFYDPAGDAGPERRGRGQRPGRQRRGRSSSPSETRHRPRA